MDEEAAEAVVVSEAVEFEFEFEALPLSKLVVEFRHPLETDSTVAMLALLSSPGLSLPGLCKNSSINECVLKTLKSMSCKNILEK